MLDVNLSSSTIVRILLSLFCFLANLAWYAAIFSNSLLALSSAVSFLGSLAFFFFSSTIFEGSLFGFFFSFLFDCFSVNDSLSRNNNINYFKNLLYIEFYTTMILNKKWKY